MSALPDDTALDMLSFALSGPGVVAAAAFTLSGVGFLLSFAEIGPRRNAPSAYFFLRVTLPSPMKVEGPDGTVSNLREGENVLRFRSLEACTVIAKRLEGPDVEYTILRTTATSVNEVFKFPQNLRAVGSKWPQDLVELRTESDPQARWAEYEQIDAYTDIDKEWSALMKGMSPIQFIGKPECRLCAGTGKVRCFRCGGVGSSAQFQCDCLRGKRACEWCANE